MPEACYPDSRVGRLMAMNQRRRDRITAVGGSGVLPLGFVSWLLVVICPAAEPIHIGSRLELFVDDYLIDTMAGAGLTLHQPVAREIALNHGAVPWEGNSSGGTKKPARGIPSGASRAKMPV